MKYNSDPSGACENNFSYGEVEDYTVIVQGTLADGKIQGFVRDAETNLSIDEATITATDADDQVFTAETPFGSHYTMMLPQGVYTISCESSGYQTGTVTNLLIIGDENVNHTFYLEPERMITGLNETQYAQVKISPNPSSNEVKIQSIAEISQLTVINQAGQLVYETHSNSRILDVNVSEFDSGIYFVKIFTHDNVITKKLVIE